MPLEKKNFPPCAHFSNGNGYGNVYRPERRFTLTTNGKLRLIFFL